MTEPLRRTYEAMPEPRVVIAVGTDAISGGLLAGSYATTGGIGGAVPVDVWVPGRRRARSPSCTRCCSRWAGYPPRQPGFRRDRPSGARLLAGRDFAGRDSAPADSAAGAGGGR